MQGFLFYMPCERYIDLLHKDKSVPSIMEDNLDFERYRSLLVEGLGYSDRSEGGHPP